MARQKLRTVETWNLKNPYDQKTPLEIAASDTTAVNLEEYLQFVLSQIRQILGTAKWNDAVPIQLQELADMANLPVEVSALETVGDLLYINGDKVGDYYSARKADPSSGLKIPAVGILTEKESLTHGTLNPLSGILTGVYGDLVPGKMYFVGMDGRPVDTIVSIGPSCYVQKIGVALAQDTLALNFDLSIIKRSA